jgi:hypothetical protein
VFFSRKSPLREPQEPWREERGERSDGPSRASGTLEGGSFESLRNLGERREE